MHQALATALLFFLVVPGAVAQKRLAIVELGAPPSMTGLGSQLTQIVLRAAREQRFALVTPEELRGKLGESAYRELRDCGENAGCISARLLAIHAELAVVGSLDRNEKSYLVRLALIDLRSLRNVSELDKAILIASRRLVRDVQNAVPGFLRGEREAPGTLKVATNVKDAEVTIDGEPVGSAPVARQLKSGAHQIRLEKNGYLPIERLVRVEAGAVSEQQFRLIRAPGQGPENELPRLQVATQNPSPALERSGFRIPKTAWFAGGGAAVAAGVGLAFGLSARSAERNLTAGYDSVHGSYAGTRRDAQLGQRDASFANISYGVAGAALLTGVVLTILENRSERAVSAAAIPGGGASVALQGRF